MSSAASIPVVRLYEVPPGAAVVKPVATDGLHTLRALRESIIALLRVEPRITSSLYRIETKFFCFTSFEMNDRKGS